MSARSHGTVLAVVAVIVTFGAAPCAASTDQQDKTCTAGGHACIANVAGKGVMQSETYLVQKRSELEKAKAALKKRASIAVVEAVADMDSAGVAAYVRGFLSDLLNAANALKVAVLAVRGAVPFFLTGEMSEGLGALTAGLFDAVVFILPTSVTQSTAFADLRQKAHHVAQVLPGIVGRVASGIKAFKQEGNISALVTSCLIVVEEFGPFAMQFLPDEVKVEVGKYLGAVEEVLSGFGSAIATYSAGNMSDAIVQMYSGLRSAIGELLPEEWSSNENFTSVVEVLDSTIGSLSSTVLLFQQKLLQSGACWKNWADRSRIRAKQCPDDHWFDGLHWCFAKGTSPPMQIRSAHGGCLDVGSWIRGLQSRPCDLTNLKQQWFFDESSGRIKDAYGRCLGTSGSTVRVRTCKPDQEENQVWEYLTTSGLLQAKAGACLSVFPETGKAFAEQCNAATKNQQWSMASGLSLLDATTKRKREAETVAATCDMSSEFTDQRGPWCYAACPEGMEPAGSRCRTECGGEYPAKSPLMCGKSYQMLGLSIQEMTAQTLKAGYTAASLADTVGVAGKLNFTINSLIDIGVGFTYPNCQ